MPRRARFDAPGTLHHVIVRGIEKRRIVNSAADRENFVQPLSELAAAPKTAVYAWALTTDHAHLLLRSSEMSLSGFMRRLLTGLAGQQRPLIPSGPLTARPSRLAPGRRYASPVAPCTVSITSASRM
jgi:REP element-mobilizing transposase RayT